MIAFCFNVENIHGEYTPIRLERWLELKLQFLPIIIFVLGKVLQIVFPLKEQFGFNLIFHHLAELLLRKFQKNDSNRKHKILK